MRHLAEYASVRRGNPFNRHVAFVRVICDVIGRLSRQVYILCRDLSVCLKLFKQMRTANKAAFAVRNRHIVNLADLCVIQPRRFCGTDTGVDHHRLMAADCVERQRWRGLCHIADFAVWNKSQLNQRLETVADTEHQALADVQKLGYSLAHLRIAEEGSNELRAAIRLVAAGEAAWNHNHLRVCNRACKRRNRFFDLRACKVFDDENLSFRTGLFECARSVIFAVCARKYRNQHARLCEFFRTAHQILFGQDRYADRRTADCLRRRLYVFAAIREDRFQYAFIRFLQRAHVHDCLLRENQKVFGNSRSDYAQSRKIRMAVKL